MNFKLCMLIDARTNFGQHWNEVTVAMVSDQELKFGEYAEIAKLTI